MYQSHSFVMLTIFKSRMIAVPHLTGRAPANNNIDKCHNVNNRQGRAAYQGDNQITTQHGNHEGTDPRREDDRTTVTGTAEENQGKDDWMGITTTQQERTTKTMTSWEHQQRQPLGINGFDKESSKVGGDLQRTVWLVTGSVKHSIGCDTLVELVLSSKAVTGARHPLDLHHWFD